MFPKRQSSIPLQLAATVAVLSVCVPGHVVRRLKQSTWAINLALRNKVLKLKTKLSKMPFVRLANDT